ncbi:hypothetical protein BT96DRAFT_1006578 [Gymnopus androsaceus JB14]|uniref:C2H2-type domain-containing protein n=1 Tax=Gymnopus androsaceus JB14 TaxID=1447944 RepID=A0A6A4GKK9_9AGAR|nr:hypothetical protein BT96DRAFT_1006578 [Gymnopus androsaceus JB14]
MALKATCRSCGDQFDSGRGLSNHQRQCKGAKHLKLELSKSRTSAAQALRKAKKQKKKAKQHSSDVNMVELPGVQHLEAQDRDTFEPSAESESAVVLGVLAWHLCSITSVCESGMSPSSKWYIKRASLYMQALLTQLSLPDKILAQPHFGGLAPTITGEDQVFNFVIIGEDSLVMVALIKVGSFYELDDAPLSSTPFSDLISSGLSSSDIDPDINWGLMTVSWGANN